MKKMKVLALALAAIMVLALLPAISFADDDYNPATYNDGYYLCGTINGVNHWNDYQAYRKFGKNPNNDAEYMLTINLKNGDAIKVRNVASGSLQYYYPDNAGDFVIWEGDGLYNIYFKPEGGVDGWHGGCFCVERSGDRIPYVAGNSISLGGEIGVNFFVNTVHWGDTEYRMYFTIKDKNDGVLETKDYYVNKNNAPLVTNIDGEICYGFTCFINVIEMAQTIEYELKTEGGYHIFSGEYSAEQYFKFIEAYGWLNANDNTFKNKEKNLIIATWNYGIQLQKFLVNQKSLTRYNMMTDRSAALQEKYVLALNSSVDQHIEDTGKCINKTSAWNTAFQTTEYELVLDYVTTLRVYIKPNSGEHTFTLDNNAVDGTLTNGEYVVTIGNIPAHELMTYHTLVADNNDNSYATFSALHYAGSMLAHSDTALWQNAGKALAAYAVYAKAYYNTNMYTDYVDYNN